MYTIPRNPENNGVAKSYNRIVVEMSRALLFDAGIGKEYWNYANFCVYMYLLEVFRKAKLWHGYT